MSKKTIIRINIILAIFTVIGGLCYDTISHNLPTKGCASFGFFLLGLINLIYGSREKYGYRSFAVLMVVGLFTGMAADIAGRMVEREINADDHRELVKEFIKSAGEAS